MKKINAFAALALVASGLSAQGNLDVSAMAVPSTIKPAEPIEVSVWITNRSTKPIDVTTVTGLYLSTNTAITTADTYLGRFTTPKLAANQTVKRIVRVNIPLGIGVGRCYIGAIADVDKKYAESNENDNTAAKATTCQGAPDLWVKSATLPSKLARGNLYIAPTVIENRGGVSTAANVGVFLSQRSTYTTGAIRLSTKWVSVARRNSTSTTLSFTIPRVAIGRWYVLIVADFDRRVAESVEGNNTRAKLVSVYALGSRRSFGSACAGSGGVTVHNAKPRDGALYPRIGYGMQFDVSKAKKFSAAMCMLGLSSQKWGAISLPLALRPLGGGLCKLYVSMDLTLPFATGATGFGGVYFRLPKDERLVGLTLNSQVLVLDNGANNLGINTTNAFRTTFGHEK